MFSRKRGARCHVAGIENGAILVRQKEIAKMVRKIVLIGDEIECYSRIVSIGQPRILVHVGENEMIERLHLLFKRLMKVSETFGRYSIVVITELVHSAQSLRRKSPADIKVKPHINALIG